MRFLLLVLIVCGATVFSGCKDESGSATPSGPATSPPTTATPATADPAKTDHPNAISLGEKTVGGLRFKATQDEPIKPGGEGAFDLVVTGGKPKAVRFWVGTENAAGSVKAKADEESPDNWHCHVEVPDPLPAGSRFWAEVEPPQGERVVVGFDLK